MSENFTHLERMHVIMLVTRSSGIHTESKKAGDYLISRAIFRSLGCDSFSLTKLRYSDFPVHTFKVGKIKLIR